MINTRPSSSLIQQVSEFRTEKSVQYHENNAAKSIAVVLDQIGRGVRDPSAINAPLRQLASNVSAAFNQFLTENTK